MTKTTHNIVTALIVVFVVLVLMAWVVGNQGDQIRKLNHACLPTDTGGGVTQCLQPTMVDTAVRACFQNDAYIGTTQEDTRHLFVQCMDDYMSMRGFK